MINELQALLSVDPNEVSGLLKEYGQKKCPVHKDLNLHFHYIRFQNGAPRLNHLISKLCDHIVSFCLKRHKLQNVKPSDYRQLYKEAKMKFAQPSGGKTGEPGELFLFFLLEGYVRVPKIFSKMSLKTSSQMHVHGSDGVHLGIDDSNLILYFGESKLYSVHTTAISETLVSIKELVSSLNGSSIDTQNEFEINILSNHLDIPPGRLREHVMDALNPYSAARDNLKYTYTCFIGFDLDKLVGQCDIADFKAAYEKKAKSCYRDVINKISRDPTLRSLSWQFFFLPLGSVDEFRRKFLDELNAV